MSQQAYFVGDHGKPASLFPRARGFNCRIEGEQVGLFGDRANHLQNTAYLRAFQGQLLNHLHRLLDSARQLADLLQAGIDVLLTLARLGFGGMYFARCMFGIFRDILYAIGYLVDRGSHEFHLLGLLLTVLLGLASDVAERACGLIQGAGRVERLADYMAQFFGKDIEVSCEGGQFIIAFGIQGLGKVAFAAGDVGHGIDGLL
ncbi:hypothetical protein D3C80_1348920 [compost metagenome]